MRTSMMVFAALLTAACAKGDDTATADSAGAATAAAGTPAANADADRATGGSGVPAGFMARVDSNPGREPGNIAEAKYTRSGDMWEVKTGPHHITWAPGDTASGSFGATARLQQMEPASSGHREGYGIFIGGANLNQSSQRYLYLLVGGTGEYMIARRDSTKSTTLKPWSASGSVPKADASGKADYTLTIHVAADTVHFLVNKAVVAALPKAGLPTDGIAGMRIGHNLHVMVQPVSITR